MLVCSTSRWKISVKNNNTDSGKLYLLMCGASLFFTPFAGLTKGWIFVFLPWGSPQIGSLPLVAAFVLTSAEACCCCCFCSSSSSSSSKYSSNFASRRTWFRVGSATRISLLVSLSSFNFFPGRCNRHLQWSALFTLLCMTGHRVSNLMLLRYERRLQWRQNRSKATTWKLCEFQLFGGAQYVFSGLTTVCWMLLPHNPYRLPQHYKRHACGPYFSCKHRFFWISPLFERQFCLNYMGTVRHWQPFWSTVRIRYIGQCWYFNPLWTAGQVRNKASCVSNSITHWENCAVAVCQHMNEGFWRVLGGEGIHSGYTEKPWPSRVLQHTREHSGISDRSEQNSSKFWHNVWYPCMGRSASLKGSLCDTFMGHYIMDVTLWAVP